MFKNLGNNDLAILALVLDQGKAKEWSSKRR
jgi:hypothetical protein